jgi:hypothetical protein
MLVWPANRPRDFLVEVSEGKIPGYSIVHKFGRNDAVPNGSWEMISLLSGAALFLGEAKTVQIQAGGNAADTAAGAGAREVMVQGIASDLTETSEAIVTDGINASVPTTVLFWRIYRAWVSACGTYGAANTGAITIESGGFGPIDLIKIGVEEGQSQFAGYTTPAGKHGHLLSAHVTVDAAKAADVRVYTRQNITDTVAPMSARRLRFYWDGIINEFTYKPVAPELSLPPLTDIWFEAEGGGAGTEVSADFELLLADD